MKVLFLSRWFPFPANNGSRQRIINLIKALAGEHEVSLLTFTSEPVSEERMGVMQAWCSRVQTSPYLPYHAGSIKAKLGMLSSVPRSMVSTNSAEMHSLAQAEARRLKPDLVLASEIDMIPYARNLDARKLIEDLEVGVISQAYGEASGVKKMRALMTWLKLNAYVRSVAREFHGCTVVSESELRLVRQMTGELPLAVVPNGVDVAACSAVRATPAPDTLIYNGSITYGPNLDAVRYFVSEIFPLVLRERPAAQLFVTGKVDGVPADQLPKHDNLILTGYVDDIMSRVAGSWAAIAPIRQGGGTRLKILESLALRTPVISTSKGAEGLGLEDGRDALIADDPQSFAQRVVHVLSSPQLRSELADCGAQTAALRFDWHVIGEGLSRFARQVAGAGT